MNNTEQFARYLVHHLPENLKPERGSSLQPYMDAIEKAMATSAPAVPEYQFIGYAEHGIHQTPGPGDAIIDSDEASDYVSECVTPLYIEAALTDGRE